MNAMVGSEEATITRMLTSVVDYIDYYDSGIVDHMDKTSGTVRSIFVTLRKKNEIVIECYNYNKKAEKNGKVDHLTIAIDSKEFSDWLTNEAYK